MDFECWACAEATGYSVRHEVVFTDSRTERSFCHEHVAELVSWELLDNNHPDKLEEPGAFAHWIAPEEVAATREP